MSAVCRGSEYYDPMPEMCEYPHCKSKADYGNMDCVTDCGEDIGVMFCTIHATAVQLVNDEWRDDTAWPDLTNKEKRRVSQIVYRLRKKGGKF